MIKRREREARVRRREEDERTEILREREERKTGQGPFIPLNLTHVGL